jgi:hypothetical protein
MKTTAIKGLALMLPVEQPARISKRFKLGQDRYVRARISRTAFWNCRFHDRTHPSIPAREISAAEIAAADLDATNMLTYPPGQ